MRGALRRLRSGHGRTGEAKRKSPLSRFVDQAVDKAVKKALDDKMAMMTLQSPTRPNDNEHNVQSATHPPSPEQAKRTSTRTRRPTAKVEEAAVPKKRGRGRPAKTGKRD